MFAKQSKSDVYEQITNALISAIEAGTAHYSMPWHRVGTPINAVTQKQYRGVNVLSLWATAAQCGFASQEWATYKQWCDIGAQVKRGERSTVVAFWKFLDSSYSADNQEGDDDSNMDSDRVRCFARAYHVFNADQVDGYQPAPRPHLSAEQRIAHADQFFSSLPIVLRHGGDRAYFHPSGDFIQMPPFDLFNQPNSFTRCSVMSRFIGVAPRRA